MHDCRDETDEPQSVGTRRQITLIDGALEASSDRSHTGRAQ